MSHKEITENIEDMPVDKIKEYHDKSGMDKVKEFDKKLLLKYTPVGYKINIKRKNKIERSEINDE